MITQEQLAAVIPQLPAKDRAFATSLATARALSHKQIWWCEELYRRALQPAPAPVAAGPDLSGIVALFDTAAKKLKHPKIRVAEGVVLKRAGESSKRPGAVNVTSEGGFGDATWYGAIERDGRLTTSRNMTADIAGLLASIAADPASAAAAYGRRFGSCCFCGRELTDKRSVDMGYGPICADRFGIPWGEKEAA